MAGLVQLGFRMFLWLCFLISCYMVVDSYAFLGDRQWYLALLAFESSGMRMLVLFFGLLGLAIMVGAGFRRIFLGTLFEDEHLLLNNSFFDIMLSAGFLIGIAQMSYSVFNMFVGLLYLMSSFLFNLLNLRFNRMVNQGIDMPYAHVRFLGMHVMLLSLYGTVLAALLIIALHSQEYVVMLFVSKIFGTIIHMLSSAIISALSFYMWTRTSSGSLPDHALLTHLSLNILTSLACTAANVLCLFAILDRSLPILFIFGYNMASVLMAAAMNIIKLVRFMRIRQYFDVALPPVPVAELVDGDADDEEPVCGVCLGTITVPAARLPCNHLFHRDCLRAWVRQNPTCPYCFMAVNLQKLARNQLAHRARRAAPSSVLVGDAMRRGALQHEEQGVWLMRLPRGQAVSRELLLALCAYAQARFHQAQLPPPPAAGDPRQPDGAGPRRRARR